MHLLAAIITSACVGGLMEWLVGASQTAAVAAALSLVSGYFGARLLTALESKATASDLRERLLANKSFKHLELSDRDAVLEIAIGSKPDGFKILAVQPVAALAFVLAAFVGLFLGGKERNPPVPSLTTIFDLASIKLSNDIVAPELQAALLSMHYAGMSKEEISATFRNAFGPIIRSAPDPKSEASNTQITNDIFKRQLSDAIYRVQIALPESPRRSVPVSYPGV